MKHLKYMRIYVRYMCEFDDAGSIGKRYRRQDEIGTPFCITFDFESLEDSCITIRNVIQCNRLEFH